MVTIDDAVKAIDPRAGRLKEARDKIALAVELLRERKLFWAALPSAREAKDDLNDFVDALKKAEKAGAALPEIMRPVFLLSQMARHREFMESCAENLKIPRAAKRRDPIKSNAVMLAKELLEDFGKEAALSREKAWHRLSIVLYALATGEKIAAGKDTGIYEYLLDPDVDPPFDFRPSKLVADGR